MRKIREDRKEKGLCTSCGNENDRKDKGLVTCSYCNYKSLINYHKRKERRLSFC